MPDKMTSVQFIMDLKKSLDWCIPSSPHSNEFNACKSMRGGEQMYVSEENECRFDCLPTCEVLRSSHFRSDNIPLPNTTHASMSVMPSSFSCSDMAAVSLPDFNPFFGPILFQNASHRAGCTRAKMVLSVSLLSSWKGGFQQNLDRNGGCMYTSYVHMA